MCIVCAHTLIMMHDVCSQCAAVFGKETVVTSLQKPLAWSGTW